MFFCSSWKGCQVLSLTRSVTSFQLTTIFLGHIVFTPSHNLQKKTFAINLTSKIIWYSILEFLVLLLLWLSPIILFYGEMNILKIKKPDKPRSNLVNISCWYLFLLWLIKLLILLWYTLKIKKIELCLFWRRYCEWWSYYFIMENDR